MLMTMRALTRAARAICYATAGAIDASHGDGDTAKAADARAALLTPVAKAFSTDIGVEVASLGVQVHGGMGYIEETGAAQHLRDARIAAIYEGTNGIQALDLAMRKVPLAGGAVVRAYLDELRNTVKAVQANERSGVRRRPARGLPRRSTASIAPRPGSSARSTRSRRRRWPARRLICGCSAMPPAAACWPTRRWRRCGSPAASRRRASPSRASLPRTSRCRRRAWSAR